MNSMELLRSHSFFDNLKKVAAGQHESVLADSCASDVLAEGDMSLLFTFSAA